MSKNIGDWENAVPSDGLTISPTRQEDIARVLNLVDVVCGAGSTVAMMLGLIPSPPRDQSKSSIPAARCTLCPWVGTPGRDPGRALQGHMHVHERAAVSA